MQIKSLKEIYPMKSPSDADFPDPITIEAIDTEYEVFVGTFCFVVETLLFPTKEDLVASLLK